MVGSKAVRRHKRFGTRTVAVFAALVGSGGLNATALAAVPSTFSFAAARASATPPLTPVLSDATWHSGAVPDEGGFINLTTRRVAEHATSVCILYDERNVYVAFHSEQRGTPVVANQTTNDVGFGLDDFVGVGIDTSGTGTQAYYFETTPRGIRYEQASENARYRPAWSAVASRAADGWNAVLKIPLNVMRIRTAAKQTWRINFVRNVAAVGEHYTWAFDGLMQDAPPGGSWPTFNETRFWPAWTDIVASKNFLSAAKPKPRLEVYGLDAVGRDREVFQQANGTFSQQNVRELGADGTYPLTPTINFVGTLNPDFSNVEVDQQTIAPQEFRRNLQEYRPFFAQGANFINASSAVQIGPNQVFYSPSVGPFDRGEKIEGTFGNQSFGVSNFKGYDRTTGNEFDDTAYGYKHALQDRTFLYWVDGVLAHHSLFGHDATNEFGVAGRNLKTGFVYGFDDAIETGSWIGHSAHNAQGFVDIHKPNYETFLGFQNTAPDYNPIDGYTQNSDIRGPILFATASGASPGLKNYVLQMNTDRFFDGSGSIHQADLSFNVGATWKNGFSLNGLGPTISELRSYSLVAPSSTGCNDPLLPRTYFTGAPNYTCGRTDVYDQMSIPVGFRDGTPAPVDASYSFGRFGYGLLGVADNGPDFVQLLTLSTSRTVARKYSVGVEYDGTIERGIASGLSGTQWLRRLSIGSQLGTDENLTISLRAINGTGGFALPGFNVAGAYHRRLRNGDELFLNFGTPASPVTLDRVIFKYLFRFGGDAGT